MIKADEYKALIVVAQGEGLESEQALGDILIDISIHHMESNLRKYINKATAGAIDLDDLRQSFLIGCSEAVAVTDIKIGDPLAFILQRGKWRAIGELGKAYRRDLRQICLCCGIDSAIFGRLGVPACRKCGAEGYQCIDRYEVAKKDESAILLAVDGRKDFQDTVVSQMFVEVFRDNLTGRKREIFDFVMYGGFDRDSCKNYIVSIAEHLGISSSNVNLRLRAIKKDWTNYLYDMGEVAS